MKITCSKRDDLMRARYDYDQMTKQYKDKIEEGEAKYRRAMDESRAYIENAVRSALGSTNLPLDIRVDRDWDYKNNRDYHCWKVRVEAHERDKSQDNVSLAWNWSAYVDSEGNVVKDSGSWSGLKAISPEQIDDLEESVRILKQLNTMDWPTILDQAAPDSYDYVDQEAKSAFYDRSTNRPDFDKQILEADIEDAIAAGEWIKMEGRPETDYYRGSRRGTYWCKIDSMTDKFVKCHIASEYNSGIRTDLATDERLAKAKLFSYFAEPFESKAL